MFKVIKRLSTAFTAVALLFGAGKALFNWLARSENDEYEVWRDDEEREDA